MRRWVGIAAVGAIALAGAALWMSQPQAERAGPPNVLIVLWDTVRADHLSLYGHDIDTTPRLNAFAREAVVYENAVSPGMWTVPSHASMFTGLPPRTHGASFEWRWLDHHHTTMAEHFKANGYDTFAFSANPNLARRGANLLQGFDMIRVSWGAKLLPLVREATRRKLLPNDASTEISPAFKGNRPGNIYYNGAPVAGRVFTRWLAGRSEKKPWLAYINYMEAHKPRVPMLKHRRKVMDESAHRLALTTDLTFLNQMAYGYGQVEFSEEQVEATRSVYDACIRELDEYTDRLFESLKARGELDNTIVVLTSDHGETLGEHHRYGHRYGVYQTLLHVPLMVWYPKKLEGQRVDTPVTTQDLFATLTELADLPEAPTATDSLPLGQRKTLASEVLSFDSAGLDLVLQNFPELDEDGWERTFQTVRQGPLKLVLDNHGHMELFDVDADPGERHDLAELRPDDLKRLRHDLDGLFDAMAPYDDSKRTPEDRPTITKREQTALEVLGYVVDDDE